MIYIYDANFWVRKQFEVGQTTREVFNRVFSMSAPTLFVWDGPHALALRRQKFPDYKVRRKPMDASIATNFQLIQAALNFTSVVQIRVPGYEGDDVIATLVQSHQDQDIRVVSNDRDLLQLGVPLDIEPLPGVPHEHTRAFKTLVGDSSDNIPGIPGFGRGAWDAADKPALLDWLAAVIDHKDPPNYPFPSRCKISLDDVRTYWDITGFVTVPNELINSHTSVGMANWAAGDAFLKEFLH